MRPAGRPEKDKKVLRRRREAGAVVIKHNKGMGERVK
jgi:hypothetical protein